MALRWTSHPWIAPAQPWRLSNLGSTYSSLSHYLLLFKPRSLPTEHFNYCPWNRCRWGSCSPCNPHSLIGGWRSTQVQSSRVVCSPQFQSWNGCNETYATLEHYNNKIIVAVSFRRYYQDWPFCWFSSIYFLALSRDPISCDSTSGTSSDEDERNGRTCSRPELHHNHGRP